MNNYCIFCQEFDKTLVENELPKPVGDRIIGSYGDYLLLPTLGAVVEGYCLLMPKAHHLSFAHCLKHGNSELSSNVEKARAFVESEYGPCIVAEHGAGNLYDMGAACCDHAHLHIIPYQDPNQVIAAYFKFSNTPSILDSFASLADFEGKSYMYLSPNAGKHLIWTASPFPRQFIRQVTASAAGIPTEWNWRLFPKIDPMFRTLKKLRNAWTANKE